MGQRHQVYVRLPAVDYGPGNPNNKKPEVIGLHHQWLYGRTAVRMLANVIRYCTAAEIGVPGSYSPFGAKRFGLDDAKSLLSAIYSTDVAEGYFHGVHPFAKGDGELSNPYMGDNNDGITVIDLLDPSAPAYAFYTLDGIESQEPRPAPHSVLTARDYALAYYPRFKDGQGRDRSDWVKPEVDYVEASGWRVLSAEELRAIFPKMKVSESA